MNNFSTIFVNCIKNLYFEALENEKFKEFDSGTTRGLTVLEFLFSFSLVARVWNPRLRNESNNFIVSKLNFQTNLIRTHRRWLTRRSGRSSNEPSRRPGSYLVSVIPVRPNEHEKEGTSPNRVTKTFSPPRYLTRLRINILHRSKIQKPR